jgi:hypothetical protein
MSPNTPGAESMRLATAILLFITIAAHAEEPKLVIKPEAFPTLVNPNCSHCVDEAKRRKDELKDGDRVLVWTRGKYDGGAVPFRFFLNHYRVISDSYGVFVHDPEAGYARGFRASLDFTFHGWRNGVMVMKHKDGTLYSCLSGVAFEGPNKGKKLEPWPTLVADWGWVLKHYPGGVAYHMFEKYKPVEFPAEPDAGSVKSRGTPDPRLPAEELVLGVEAPSVRARPRAYLLSDLAKLGPFAALTDRFECGNEVVVLWQAATRTATAYRTIAVKYKPTTKLSELGEVEDTKPTLRIAADGKSETAPFVDAESGSRFDVAGRCVEGKLKGYCLQAQPAVVVKWFAWAAEYPGTNLHQPKKPPEEKKEPTKADDAAKEVAGAAEFLRSVPKKYALFQGHDAKAGRVKLLLDGETEAKEWPVEPDAEVKILGWWGRLEQLPVKGRVWVWFKTDRKKQPVSVLMIADEISEQDIHGDGAKVTKTGPETFWFERKKGPEGRVGLSAATKMFRGNDGEAANWLPATGDRVYTQTDGEQGLLVLDPAAFAARRDGQKRWLRERWAKEGLPGTVTFAHVSGEADLMLDHEALRRARALKTGDKVTIAADPPVAAVVKTVVPWRERTQVRVVINGLDLAELTTGKRIHLLTDAPSPGVDDGDYPPGIGLKRTKEERVEWFLANIYCTCKVGGDICTGHFYTLASCNPNGCATPNATRKKIAEKIDAGLTDQQIWDYLKTERGPALLRPHLLP